MQLFMPLIKQVSISFQSVMYFNFFSQLLLRPTNPIELCDLIDLEPLDETMVDAFRSVLMLLPSTPSNPKYEEFIDESRKFSYMSPFNAPTPPYPDLKFQVMHLMRLYNKYIN